MRWMIMWTVYAIDIQESRGGKWAVYASAEHTHTHTPLSKVTQSQQQW